MKILFGILVIIGAYVLGVASPYLAEIAPNGNPELAYKAITTAGLIASLMGVQLIIQHDAEKNS